MSQFSRARLMAALLLGLLIGTLPSLAQGRGPADMSVAAYEQFRASLEADLNKAVAKEYQGEEDRIAKLSVPFRKGDRITVNIRRGNVIRQETGIYKDYASSGMYGSATIGDRKVLLEDIDELDRERLRLGHNPEQVTQYIRGLRDALADKKEAKKVLLSRQFLSDAGYTEEFFKTTVQLGPRFWYLRELGDGVLRLLVDIPPAGDFVTLTLQGKLEMPNHAVLLLDKQALGSSTDLDAEGQLVAARAWEEVSTKLLRQEGWTDPVKALNVEYTLWVVAPEVGQWYLKGKLRARPKQDPDTRAWKGEYLFHLLPASVKDNPDQATPAMTKLQSDLQKQREAVAAQLAAAEAERQKRLEGMASEERQRQEEQEKLMASAAARAEMQAEMEKRYGWQVPEMARALRTAEGFLEGKWQSLTRTNDPNGPETLGGQKVLRVSTWTLMRDAQHGDRARNFELLGMQYRIVELEPEEGQRAYLLQYALNASNGGNQDLPVFAKLEFTLNDGAALSQNDQHIMERSWFGALLGTVNITQDQVLGGLKSGKVAISFAP